MRLPHTERVDRLDTSLFDHIESGGTSEADLRSLLAMHAALGARAEFRYLEIGSYLGSSLQAIIADPRCTQVVSIDRREWEAPDELRTRIVRGDNTTAHMLEFLSRVPGADLEKLTTIDVGIDAIDARSLRADLCFINGEHTDAAALRDARFCRRVLHERGVIVFHDRTRVDGAIRAFLRELPHYCAYPLAHELFVVELNCPSLLVDARVREQIPRGEWLVAARLRLVRPALWISARVRRVRRAAARAVVTVGTPRRVRTALPVDPQPSDDSLFEVNTFVTDRDLYAEMLASFVQAGFGRHSFVELTDRADGDPYFVIRQMSQTSRARYPILCHQDVRTDQGAGYIALREALEQLDRVDPHWVVAGTAGVTRQGRLVRRVVYRDSGLTADRLPLSVVTLDENFLVFNRRNVPRCSPGLSGFHFYGSDVSMNALRDGGSAYVIDFPMSHLSGGRLDVAYRLGRERFREVWNRRCWFCFVPTPNETLFVSRFKSLRRVFGATRVIGVVDQAEQRYG
jgi:hypothetical protein